MSFRPGKQILLSWLCLFQWSFLSCFLLGLTFLQVQYPKLDTAFHETMPGLNRAKALLYMFLCTCRNMRFIFFYYSMTQ